MKLEVVVCSRERERSVCCCRRCYWFRQPLALTHSLMNLPQHESTEQLSCFREGAPVPGKSLCYMRHIIKLIALSPRNDWGAEFAFLSARDLTVASRDRSIDRKTHTNCRRASAATIIFRSAAMCIIKQSHKKRLAIERANARTGWPSARRRGGRMRHARDTSIHLSVGRSVGRSVGQLYQFMKRGPLGKEELKGIDNILGS